LQREEFGHVPVRFFGVLLQFINLLFEFNYLFLYFIIALLDLREPNVELVNDLEPLPTVSDHLVDLSAEFPDPVLLHYDLLKHGTAAFLEIVIQLLPHLVEGVSEVADLLSADLVDVPEIVVVCLKRSYLELHHLLLSFNGIYLFLELLFDAPDFCLVTIDLPIAFKEEFIITFKPN